MSKYEISQRQLVAGTGRPPPRWPLAAYSLVRGPPPLQRWTHRSLGVKGQWGCPLVSGEVQFFISSISFHPPSDPVSWEWRVGDGGGEEFLQQQLQEQTVVQLSLRVWVGKGR